MEHRVKYLLIGILLAASSVAFAGEKAVPATSGTTAFDRVVDRVIAREAENNKTLRTYSPLVETYLQSMKTDRDVGMVPVSDQYYLTRVGFKKSLEDINFHAEPGFLSRVMHGVSKDFRTEFVSSGFNWMMTMDMRGLDRAHYSFDYQGREFLGDVRCIVIDVTPKAHAGTGRFLGRVWVEDKDFNVVRFNGTFAADAQSVSAL